MTDNNLSKINEITKPLINVQSFTRKQKGTEILVENLKHLGNVKQRFDHSQKIQAGHGSIVSSKRLNGKKSSATNSVGIASKGAHNSFTDI